MPAAPIHHTPIDSTKAWDGDEKAFDKKKGDFVKFYAWVDEGEVDPKADGTDQEDGWGPHHDINDGGVPGDANEKGFQAAMAALNGAHGSKSIIPAGDRQAVWDHLAAHYKDAGTKAADIPALAEANSKSMPCTICRGRKRIGFRFSLPVSEMSTEADEPTMDDNQPVTFDNGDSEPGSNVGVGPTGITILCPVCGGVGSIGIDGNGLVVVPGATDGTPHPLGDGDADQDDIPFYPLDPAATEAQQGAYPYDQVDDGLGTADETSINAAEASDLAVSGPNPAEDYMPMGATSKDYPKENLIRTRRSDAGAPAVLLRDALIPGTSQSGGSTMYGYFSTFDSPYEIDSIWEGRFIETVAPGAFKKTIKSDVANMRVLYDHGFDPQLGNKPIGPVRTLKEDGVGAYYEVPLLDTDYNRDFLLPALRGQLMSGEQVGSQLGASFRFIVTGETWDRSGKRTKTNPNGLDQRTITEAQVLEFGPVTFPASPTATSGVRSGSDEFIHKLRTDPLALARFTERTSYKVVERLLHTADENGARSTTDAAKETHGAAADGHAARVRQLKRRARLALLDPI